MEAATPQCRYPARSSTGALCGFHVPRCYFSRGPTIANDIRFNDWRKLTSHDSAVVLKRLRQFEIERGGYHMGPKVRGLRTGESTEHRDIRRIAFVVRGGRVLAQRWGAMGGDARAHGHDTAAEGARNRVNGPVPDHVQGGQ